VFWLAEKLNSPQTDGRESKIYEKGGAKWESIKIPFASSFLFFMFIF